MIKRSLQTVISEKINRGKAIVLIGARQVGKSTLFEHLTSNLSVPVLTINCDDPTVRETLTNISATELRLLIGDNKVIMIDEAQRVSDIGLVAKRIVDNYDGVKLLITGSSTLGIRNSINEPLTGRKYEYTMYPISTAELYETEGLISVKQSLESRLIYGSYPDVITHPEDAKDILINLSDSYLYKDILEMESVRKPEILRKLLIALALQIGSEVSYNELALTIGCDPKTVEKYIDLLEKCFVIFRVGALSRNLRNELKKSKKIYFFDIGIRNAIIGNFSPVELRGDMGALWENFIIVERMKRNSYAGKHVNYYFWRTSDQKEIDFIEESDGEFDIFEMKWSPKRGSTKFPQAFIDAYKCRNEVVVTPENYLDVLL